MKKTDLLNMMHAAGFDWITDLGIYSGVEMVASPTKEGKLWWRSINVEGSGFEQLFRGSIKALEKQQPTEEVRDAKMD